MERTALGDFSSPDEARSLRRQPSAALLVLHAFKLGELTTAAAPKRNATPEFERAGDLWLLAETQLGPIAKVAYGP